MRSILSLFFVLMLIVGCADDDEVAETTGCNFEDGNIAWLNEKIEDFNLIDISNIVEIYQFTYKEETVFLIKDCVYCSDVLGKVYNCAGELICEFGGIAGLNICIDFETEATNKELIWTNINNRVIIDNGLYNNIDTSHYLIESVSLEENILKVTVSTSGCNNDVLLANLIDSNNILESLPVQRNLKIDLEVNEGGCEALFLKDYEFDLSSLQVNGETLIHFNLEGWSETIVYNYGEEETKKCDFKDGNITWLNEKIENFEKRAGFTISEVYQYTYKEETVFLVKDCVNCSDALDEVYNCGGEVICEFGGIAGLNTCIDFETEATNKELIWTNANNEVNDG